jgi:type IV fimbrial biogenesis protein FimT
MPRRNGFTLLEMLVVIAVAAILVTLSLPSWHHFVERTQVTTQINELLGQIRYARSEAVRRGKRVVICKSKNQTQCTDGDEDWDRGWIVFVDADGNSTLKVDKEDILLQHRRSRESTILRANRGNFSLKPIGTATSGTWTLCPKHDGVQARAIIINGVGRARVSNRDSGNHALACT